MTAIEPEEAEFECVVVVVEPAVTAVDGDKVRTEEDAPCVVARGCELSFDDAQIPIRMQQKNDTTWTRL